MSANKLNFLLFVTLLLAGCAGTSGPDGQDYEEQVIPGKTALLNLTGQPSTTGAAELYFSASQRIEMMVTFHDRLLAFQVDGKYLPGASKGNKVTYPTGYQAIALSPGIHTISYCHMTRSTLATGVAMCNFEIVDFNFEANTRYMVMGNIAINSEQIGNLNSQVANVRTRMVKLD
jgi:hypothetical protein